MPVDFLVCSPIYRRKTSPAVRQRRAAVVQHLTAAYTIPHGKKQKILAALRADSQPDMTPHTLDLDASVYRSAYEYLTTKDERTRAKLVREAASDLPRARGVKYLNANRILTWKQVMDRIGQTPHDAHATAQPSAAPLERAVHEPKAPTPDTTAAAQPAVRHDSPTIGDVARLDAAIAVLREENAKIARDLEHTLDLLAEQEQRLKTLETQLASSRAIWIEQSPMERSSAEPPDHTVPERAEQPSEQHESVPNGFPEIAAYKGKSLRIVYDLKFTKEIARHHNGIRTKIAKAIGFVACDNPTHPSLQTKRISKGICASDPHRFPKGSHQSRAGNFRFVWSVDHAHGLLHVHSCYHRGSSPFSEA